MRTYYLHTIVLLTAVLFMPNVASDPATLQSGGGVGAGGGAAIPASDTAVTRPVSDESEGMGREAVLELQTIKGDFTRTGREIMDEVYRRHQQYPYVYEEQTMIMMDQEGLRDTRKLQRYSRVEQDGGEDFMLIFVSPREVRGVALLAHRDRSGRIKKSVYLPALGNKLIEGEEVGDGSSFLGSDFAVGNLTGEVLDNYFYVRRQDQMIGDANFFVVDVYHSKEDAYDKKTLRRHFIRRDNYFIAETDYYDRHGRLYKKQSSHDLKHLEDEMWRANMLLMDNIRDQHKTLIKIDRRIYSRDYVPREMFTAQWLYKNYPDLVPKDTPVEETTSGQEQETGTSTVNITVSDANEKALKP